MQRRVEAPDVRAPETLLVSEGVEAAGPQAVDPAAVGSCPDQSFRVDQQAADIFERKPTGRIEFAPSAII